MDKDKLFLISIFCVFLFIFITDIAVAQTCRSGSDCPDCDGESYCSGGVCECRPENGECSSAEKQACKDGLPKCTSEWEGKWVYNQVSCGCGNHYTCKKYCEKKDKCGDNDWSDSHDKACEYGMDPVKYKDNGIYTGNACKINGQECRSSGEKCTCCGDSVVQSGEACDLGYSNGNDFGEDGLFLAGECRIDCTFCGDGILQEEHGEECDPAMEPGEEGYDPHCSFDCFKTAQLECIKAEFIDLPRVGDYAVFDPASSGDTLQIRITLKNVKGGTWNNFEYNDITFKQYDSSGPHDVYPPNGFIWLESDTRSMFSHVDSSSDYVSARAYFDSTQVVGQQEVTGEFSVQLPENTVPGATYAFAGKVYNETSHQYIGEIECSDLLLIDNYCGDGIIQRPNMYGEYELCDVNPVTGKGDDSACPGMCHTVTGSDGSPVYDFEKYGCQCPVEYCDKADNDGDCLNAYGDDSNGDGIGCTCCRVGFDIPCGTDEPIGTILCDRGVDEGYSWLDDRIDGWYVSHAYYDGSSEDHTAEFNSQEIVEVSSEIENIVLQWEDIDTGFKARYGETPMEITSAKFKISVLNIVNLDDFKVYVEDGRELGCVPILDEMAIVCDLMDYPDILDQVKEEGNLDLTLQIQGYV